MLRRSLTIWALMLASFVLGAGHAAAASGQVAPPPAHRLHSILVDLHRPTFPLGTKKVASGFVATNDGIVVASASGLKQVELGAEVKLEWADRRRAEGWLVWKDEEVGFVIVRLHEPLPLFPTVGWRRDGGPRRGETLFGPGPVTGGQPALAEAVVTDVVDLTLPSGRRLKRVLVMTSPLGTGLLRSPLLDEEGNLAAMVSSLAPPPGAAPGTVVAVPLRAIWPDLVAARRMRSPRQEVSQPALARPSYRIGIGIGSGGIRPRIGIGLGGGIGGLSTLNGRRGQRDDPFLRREQEKQDLDETEALERALERQMGSGPTESPPPALTAAGSERALSAPGEWRAGAASVTSTAEGSGQGREVRPETLQRGSPSIGSAWNPAGPPQTASPSSRPTRTWPVVVEPNVPTSLRRQQQEADRTKTEALETELARRDLEGTPTSAPQGEIIIQTARPATHPSSSPGRRSLEEMEAELAAVRARTEALKQELEALGQGSSGRR